MKKSISLKILILSLTLLPPYVAHAGFSFSISSISDAVGDLVDDTSDNVGDLIDDTSDNIGDELEVIYEKLFGSGDDNYSTPSLNMVLYPYKKGLIASTGSCGTYYSPNGGNIRGGGSSVRVNQTNSNILSIHEYNDGLLISWRNKGVYWSPDGNWIDGGGQTQATYPVNDDKKVIILHAENAGIIYREITSVNGNTSIKSNSIYFASDLTKIGNGELIASSSGTFSKENGLEFTTMLPSRIIAYQGKYIAALDNQKSGILAEYDSLTAIKNGVYTIKNSKTALATQFYQYKHGLGVIYNDNSVIWSPNANYLDGQGSGKTIYSGERTITSITPYNSLFVPIIMSDITIPLQTPGGLMVGLNDGDTYYSPDGNNLVGGGNSILIADTKTASEIKNYMNNTLSIPSEKLYIFNHGADKEVTSHIGTGSTSVWLNFFELNGTPAPATIYKRTTVSSWSNKGEHKGGYTTTISGLSEELKVASPNRCIYASMATVSHTGLETNELGASDAAELLDAYLVDHYGFSLASLIPFKDYIPFYKYL